MMIQSSDHESSPSQPQDPHKSQKTFKSKAQMQSKKITPTMMDNLSASARSDSSTITSPITSSSSSSANTVRRNSALEDFMQDLLAGRSIELIIDSARSSPSKSWDSIEHETPPQDPEGRFFKIHSSEHH